MCLIFCLICYSNITGTNVALHKRATQHPGQHKGFKASNAVDGSTGPFSDRTCSNTTEGSPDNPPWWRVDMETFHRIIGIKIYIGKTCKELIPTLKVIAFLYKTV